MAGRSSRCGRSAARAACALLAILALAAVLAGCGNETDAQKIHDVIVLSVTLPNGDDCDNAYADIGLRMRYANPVSSVARNACHADAARTDKPTAADVTIRKITRVNDMTATAVFSVKGGPTAKVQLTEEGGHWKIDAYYVVSGPPPSGQAPPATTPPATTPTATTPPPK